MNSAKLHKILSPEHIQDTGRDLWQFYHDNDNLEDLPDAVADKIAQEVSAIVWPAQDIPESVGDLGWEMQDLIQTLVTEGLDVQELLIEATDNAEEARLVEEAKKGEY